MHLLSLFLSLWCGHLVSDVQLQNSLKTDLCLDQGPDTENVPIMYICHGMTPQVSPLRDSCARSVHVSAWHGEGELGSVMAALGPGAYGAFH